MVPLVQLPAARRPPPAIAGVAIDQLLEALAGRELDAARRLAGVAMVPLVQLPAARRVALNEVLVRESPT